MNKIYKVVWNKARHCYMVGSEFISSHSTGSMSKRGSKSLAAALAVCAVCSMGTVFAAAPEPEAGTTNASQYVAFDTDYIGEVPTGYTNNQKGYYVHDGYILEVNENGGKYTDFSDNSRRVTVKLTGSGISKDLLESTTTINSNTGTTTSLNESLQKITLGSFVGVSHSGGVEVPGNYNYIINDPTWKYKPGITSKGDWVDVGKKGFVTTKTSGSKLKWNGTNYTFNNEDVDNSNIYVIDGQIGVFTDADQQHVYDGTVYGLHNEILMTQYVPGTNGEVGKYYSYWAAEVDGSANSLEKVTVAQVNKVVDNIHENQDKLNNADIKEVKMTSDANKNSATFTMVRNGTDKDRNNIPVDGAAITIENGGGTGGSGSEHDTWISVGNTTDNVQKFYTGSKVEAITTGTTTNDITTQDITGITINGTKYNIKAGTTYTAGNGINIDSTNNNTISVKLKDGENNLAVDDKGLSLNKDLTGISGITGAGADAANITFNGANVKLNKTVSIDNTGKISGVANGEISASSKEAVNGSQLHEVETKSKTEVQAGTNTSVDTTTAADGHTVYTVNATDTTYRAGNGIAIDSTNNNTISVKLKDGENNLAVDDKGLSLNKDLTGITSIAGEGEANITFNGANVKLNKTISIDNTGKISGVANGEISASSKEAVNGSQLHEVETKSKTEVQAGTNTSVDTTTAADGHTVYTVNATDTTYRAGNGIAIDSTNNNTISVKLKDGENNLAVDDKGLSLNKDLTGISSITGAGADAANITFNGANVKLNKTVSIDNTGKISGVANGEISASSKEAVNGSQLHEVETKSKTEVQAGTNTSVDTTTAADGHTVYTVNATDTTYRAGNGIAIDSTNNNTISVKLKDGENNLAVDDKGLSLNKELTGISSITGAGADAAKIKFDGAKVTFNNKVTIDNTGKISGVTAGEVDTDAVNVSQLNTVKTEAGKHTTLSNGKNTTVTSTKTENGPMDYQVNVAGDLKDITSIANGDLSINLNKYGIRISNGKNKSFSITDDGMGMTYIGSNYTTKSIMLGENGTTISGGLSVADSKIANVADGVADTDAVNFGQLNAVNETANKGWKLNTKGGTATDVKPGDTVEFGGDDNITVSRTDKNVSVTLKNDLTGITSIAGAGADAAKITFNGADVTLNDKVTIDNTGKISGVTAGVVDTDAVNVSQLNAVNETANKGWKLNTKDGTATDVKPGDTVEFGGDANITVSHTGKNVSVTLNKDLTGLTSVTTNNAYVTNVDETNDNSVTNVQYVNNQIAGVALGAGDGISIKDKKINVKLKDGEENLVVNQDGLSLNTTLQGMEAINGVGGGNIRFASDGGITINNIRFNSDGRIQNVVAGTADTDAVNVKQLKDAVAAGNSDTHIRADEYAVGDDNKVSMDVVDKNGTKIGDVTITDVAKASDVGDVSKIADNIKNSDGTKTTVVDAVNNLNKNVGDLNYSNVAKGDIKDGDNTTTAIGKLNQKLSDVETKAGAHTTVTAGDNITIKEGTNTNGGKEYNVALAKDITVDSVTAGDTKMTTDGVTVGTDVSLKKDGLTAGDTKVTNSGLAIGEKTYVSKDGLNANSQKVTNVAAGEVSANSTDAVNGSQLYATNQAVINNAENISTLNRSLSNLDNRVNKVGAGAAALAALHPLDFDPDAKWDFAAGYGNYRGTNAAAVGAYYRPNEDTMFSVGGTFGNGENMVNAGVSFKIGAGSSHVSTSRVAMAKEIKELRSELEAMKSAMLDANAGKKMDTSKLQLFPDVPKNHWAYEYVAQLAGNGMIEGYPDGNFAGDRPMTRYEFAAVLYRAMTKGAVLSDKILNEFSHELEYFTVDTIAKDKDGNPTIQRVRTVKG